MNDITISALIHYRGLPGDPNLCGGEGRWAYQWRDRALVTCEPCREIVRALESQPTDLATVEQMIDRLPRADRATS